MKLLKKFLLRLKQEKFNMKRSGWFIAIKRLITSVVKNDFFGMAAEMGFMLVI